MNPGVDSMTEANVMGSLCNSPLTLSGRSPARAMQSESAVPSLDGVRGLLKVAIPSEKNFKTVMHVPATVPCPVG